MQQQRTLGNDALFRSRIALKHLIFVMLPNALRSIVDLTLSYLGKSLSRDFLHSSFPHSFFLVVLCSILFSNSFP
jgi:hypothetical protein